MSRSDFFELRLQSLAICDFEVAAIRVTKPLAWYKCQNSQNAQKCLRESAKSDLVSLGRESQKSLSHRANPVSHRAKHPKTQFRTVQETVLGLSLRRPGNTFRTLPKALLGILAVLTLVPGQRGRGNGYFY